MKHQPGAEPRPFSTPPAAGDKPRQIRFTPVPRQRRHRNGWTEERQRDFIGALSLCGSVTRAARSVGMTPRSAYQLLDADGADSFAAAWDRAIRDGIERIRIEALERSLRGAPVAVFRRGKLVRVEHRTNDRLAIAVLSGRERSIDDLQRTNRVVRRAHRLDLRVVDEARKLDGGTGEATRAASDFVLDRLERESAGENVERTGRERPWPVPEEPERAQPRLPCLPRIRRL